jgi:hypothetical protein
MFRAIMPTYREALMNELWMWDYEGKTEWGKIEEPQKGDYPLIILDCKPDKYGVTTYRRDRSHVTHLRPAKVVDADTKLVSDLSLVTVQKQDICASHDCNTCICPQLIEVEKRVLDQITPPEPKKTLLTREQRETVFHSVNDWRKLPWDFVIRTEWQFVWTRAGHSPYAEDWQHILNPKVEEPTGFGAINNPKSKSYVPVGDNFLDSCHYIWQAVRLLSPDFAKAMLINSVMLTPNKDGSYSFNANIRKDDK